MLNLIALVIPGNGLSAQTLYSSYFVLLNLTQSNDETRAGWWLFATDRHAREIALPVTTAPHRYSQ